MQEFRTKIKEVFASIQGEGLDVGKKHIFVRFAKCNLKCKFCDTDFNFANEMTIDELYQVLSGYNCNTVSLTGGEPLLDADFLFEFFNKYHKKLNKRIYLETNGTLPSELKKIINFVDVISMDVKIQSSTNQDNQFNINEEFIKNSLDKKLFIKVVFDSKINDFEIDEVVKLAKKYDKEIILQPKMPMEADLNLEEIFEKFYLKYNNIRLIPQTHKFLDLK